ncbi:MAG: DUF1232 domain-containing protein [Polyangiaceae bacterium]|nr:DUF1232 domain-containing protein [Polyangiaceae bacterium]MCE7888936.1 DUF1232 domain-containing protein [Sorangiineae bacterium PRO1]MCL4754776.1 DUF1232 domain-containing protein [Myxococcales bacterium]
MTELDSRCLEAFPTWLRTLGEDARALAALVENESAPAAVRKSSAAALNYLFKSLDLIPDGIEDLGFIDDAFVFRVAASRAGAGDAADPVVSRLAADTGLIRDFLGDDFSRLEAYVAGLGGTASRGRTVDDILADASVLAVFVREVRTWADGYKEPAFQRDAKNLVKLKSFLCAKLPK